MFHLLKWYLDVVTDDGGVAIGYAARLRWGAVRVGYASLLLAAPSGSCREQATLRGAPVAPGFAGFGAALVAAALVMALVTGFAMGVDFPGSNRRFSRLAAA